MSRALCWFSCGAASAVATRIAIDELGDKPLTIAYTRVVEEHSDNMRFLSDCEKWFSRSIRTIGDESYGMSAHQVMLRSGYLVGPKGAACTRILKKNVRKRFERPDDTHVFGFTYEEQERLDKFIDANNVKIDAPLIRHQLTKKDCLALIDKAGIELPMMYRLGYKNNNCVGCVKGGAGYWNKIRRDFPDAFERMCVIEERLGRTVTKWTEDGKVVRKPLRLLPVDAGRQYEDEPDFECGITCELMSESISEQCDDL